MRISFRIRGPFNCGLMRSWLITAECVIRAIEFGGDYSTERLDELHDGLSQFDCHGLAYEIW